MSKDGEVVQEYGYLLTTAKNSDLAKEALTKNLKDWRIWEHLHFKDMSHNERSLFIFKWPKQGYQARQLLDMYAALKTLGIGLALEKHTAVVISEESLLSEPEDKPEE